MSTLYTPDAIPSGPLPVATALAARDARWRDIRQYVLPTEVGDLRTITVDGAADGTPQLLVHGLGVSSATWLDVLPLLAERGPVAAIDLPGFGGSVPAAGVRPDVATLTHTIELARRALDWDRMILHGNSLGGLLAARHAVTHPATVAALVLAAPSFSPGPGGITQLTPASLIGIAPLVLPGVGELAMRAAARSGGPFPGAERVGEAVFADPAGLRPALTRVLEEESAGLASRGWRRAGMLAAARSLAAELAAWWRTDRIADAVDAPTTLIVGAEDRLLPAGIAERLRARRPDWQVHILDGAGHSPFVERPDGYAEISRRAADPAA